MKIIKEMKRPIRPTDIAKETELNKSHVSRSLKEFVDKGIAECLTPNQSMGRYYALTGEGKEILNKLKSGE